jgi:hypothetical protein
MVSTGVSKWWLLVVPLIIVIGFAVAVVSNTGNPRPTRPAVQHALYTAPSGTYEVFVMFGDVQRIRTGVVITENLAADGVATILFAGDDQYRITEVDLPGPERPTGTEHCRSNAPTAHRDDGRVVDGRDATFCFWTHFGNFRSEAFVLRNNRVFLIEHSSRTDDKAPFRRLLDGFRFLE